MGIPRAEQITGKERARLGRQLAKRYRNGETLQEIADDIGRSRTCVRAILADTGVTFRRPGRRVGR